MKTNKRAGSFNIPDELLKEVNKVKVKEKDPESSNDVEDLIESIEENEPEEKKVIESKKDDPEELLENIKKDLKIELTEDDLWNVLFNSSLIKKNIEIFPGRVYASFKYGLTVDELAYIDTKMSEAVDSKLMETGFKALNTRHLLSHVLLELGKPDNIKPIGKNPEERFKEIGSMNSLLLEMLAKKWNMFLFLIDETIKKDESIKK